MSPPAWQGSHALLGQPRTKLARVYGQNRASLQSLAHTATQASMKNWNQDPGDHQDVLTQSEATGDALLGAPVRLPLKDKTLSEQMAEIDQMGDEQLSRLTHGLRHGAPVSTLERGQLVSSQSSQSSCSQESGGPLLSASITKSGLSAQHARSPSSPWPVTPHDLSPLNPMTSKGDPQSSKRPRIVESESESESISLCAAYSTRPKVARVSSTTPGAAASLSRARPQDLSDDEADDLPSMDQIIDEEKALAQAQAEAELAGEAQRNNHASHIQSPALSHSSSFQHDDSGLEFERPHSHKLKKKSKGLTKQEQLENQRTVAMCLRQRDARLTASCRAPSTRLQDIVNKAAHCTALTKTGPLPPSSPRALPPKGPQHQMTFSVEHTLVPNGSLQSIRAGSNFDLSPSSPIGDFPPQPINLGTESRCGNSGSPLDDNLDEDELPNLDEALSTARPASDRGRAPDKTAGLKNVARMAAKQFLRDPKRGTRDEDELPREACVSHASDSDSDLQIIGKPLKSQQPTLYNRTKGLAGQLHASIPSKSISSRHQGPKSLSNPTSKDNAFMKQLLAKSALEGAKIRRQKQLEFVHRGGRLIESHHVLSSAPLHLNPVAQRRAEESEDQGQEQWVDHDLEELGSGSEIDFSGEEDPARSSETQEGSDSEAQDENEQAIDNNADHSDGSDSVEYGLHHKRSRSSQLRNAPCPQDIQPVKTTIITASHAVCSSTRSVPKVLAPDSSSSKDCFGRLSPCVADSSVSDVASEVPPPPSPIDLPGFGDHLEGFREGSPPQCTGTYASKTAPTDCSLPGFAHNGQDSKGLNTSLPLIGDLNHPRPATNQPEDTGFSQLFGDDDQIKFTHPPPLKEAKTPVRTTTNALSVLSPGAEELNGGLLGTCILPSVRALPEEQERDFLMVMMDAKDRSDQDQETDLVEYVNHRGLLTQNKPSLFVEGPPDSPLLSQDLIARTPFALRKDKLTSPCPNGTSAHDKGDVLPAGHEHDFAFHDDAILASPLSRNKCYGSHLSPTSPSCSGENAFSAIMQARRVAKLRPKSGAGRVYLQDQAEESDDEDGLLVRRGHHDDDEEEDSSEEDQEVLRDLVDDDDDDRDAETKIQGEKAVEELAMLHQRQADEKQAQKIAQIVEGKVRIRQAKKQGGDGGLTDSDSEDDEEAELLKANRRAQEYAAKKQKRAIHTLAEKHTSFFKSYEEGTSAWVDEQDLACLQPETSATFPSDDDDEEDGTILNPYGPSWARRPGFADKLQSGQNGVHDEERSSESDGGRRPSPHMTSSSPARVPIYKISGALGKPVKPRPEATFPSTHGDLDDIYGTKTLNQLSERQRALAASLAGEEGIERRRAQGLGGALTRSSAITYHSNQEKQRSRRAPVPHPPATDGIEQPSNASHSAATKRGSTLAKLKVKGKQPGLPQTLDKFVKGR